MLLYETSSDAKPEIGGVPDFGKVSEYVFVETFQILAISVHNQDDLRTQKKTGDCRWHLQEEKGAKNAKNAFVRAETREAKATAHRRYSIFNKDVKSSLKKPPIPVILVFFTISYVMSP